jgi:hypothetical protein
MAFYLLHQEKASKRKERKHLFSNMAFCLCHHSFVSSVIISAAIFLQLGVFDVVIIAVFVLDCKSRIYAINCYVLVFAISYLSSIVQFFEEDFFVSS